MTRAAELVGQVFHRLTVMSKASRTSGGKSVWLCHCECGRAAEVSVTHLRSGHTSSCGCYFAERNTAFRDKEQLVGLKYGRLTVLGRDGDAVGRKRHLWQCRCDCGAVVMAEKTQLKSGQWNSCGCLTRDRTIERNTTHGLSKTREYRIAKDARRRRYIDASPSHFTYEDVSRILLLQKGKCACCKKKLNGKYDVDHVTSLAKGGDNSVLNIQILCPICNRRKSAKDPVTFMQEQGYLI